MASRVGLAFLLMAALLGSPGCADPPPAAGSGTPDDPNAKQLEAWWKLYQTEDAGWPKARDQWYGLGGNARETLVLSLLRALLAAPSTQVRRGNAIEPAWKRPQRELTALPADGTVPYLVAALRAPASDPTRLDPLADALADFAASDALIAALDAPQADDGRSFAPYALKALVRIGGGKALARVETALRSDPKWEVRGAAAEAFGEARASDRERAAAALVPGLADADPFVVRETIEALGRLKAVEQAPALVDAAERAHRAGDATRVESLRVALRKLTGVDPPGNDWARWRQIAESAARNAAERRR